MKDIILLAKYKNPTLKNYNLELVEQLTEIKPDTIKILLLGDEDDDLNNYIHNKTNYKQGLTESVTKKQSFSQIQFSDYVDYLEFTKPNK